MGKKVRKYTPPQEFSSRKEEEARLKESPFSSIVLKEKKESVVKDDKRRGDGKKKRGSEVVQGYDPNASFADILANFERTGNPYAMPKKKADTGKSVSFGDILDKWEGKDKKKKVREEDRVKSSYKATKDFGQILSEFEKTPVPDKERPLSVIDEEIEVHVDNDVKEADETSLFKKESEEEFRSPAASWSIYGNNESFVRPETEAREEDNDSSLEKAMKEGKKSSYKPTKDFGEILSGFYSSDDSTPSSDIVEEIGKIEEEIAKDDFFFRKESAEETRSPEASWSVYGNNGSFQRKESEKKEEKEGEKKSEGVQRKKDGRAKRDFSKIYDSYESKKKEKNDVKTFEEIIKEKGDLPEKKDYTISQLRTMMPQATLDLHGKTQEEALAAVTAFLSDCRAHRIRKVSIITGKGLHSEGGVGVLRDAVIALLDSDGGISEKNNAPLQYGGNGALWVILKKS